MAKRIILWSELRCLSTAFYASMSTLRGKHFQELFSGPYYFGPNRRSDLYPRLLDSELELEGLSSPNDLTYDAMKKVFTADYPGLNLVFAKEHAHCLPEEMYEDMITGSYSEVIHTFLIRDPKRALYSNYKVMLKVSSQANAVYMDPPNGGFYELNKFYNFVKTKKGTVPVVIDAADLQTHPDEMMKGYCDAVGIQFDPKMTTWEPGSVKAHFKVRSFSGAWNDSVSQSCGFIKTKPEEQMPVPLHELPIEVVKCMEDSKVYYEDMKKDCIKPALIS